MRLPFHPHRAHHAEAWKPGEPLPEKIYSCGKHDRKRLKATCARVSLQIRKGPRTMPVATLKSSDRTVGSPGRYG